LDKATIQAKFPNELIGHLSCAAVKGYSIYGEDLPAPVDQSWDSFLHDWASHIADLKAQQDVMRRSYEAGLITLDELNALVDLPTPTIQYRPEGVSND
jgi:hypothetical protein